MLDLKVKVLSDGQALLCAGERLISGFGTLFKLLAVPPNKGFGLEIDEPGAESGRLVASSSTIKIKVVDEGGPAWKISIGEESRVLTPKQLLEGIPIA